MNVNTDLFAEPADPAPQRECLCDGAVLLRGFALTDAGALLDAFAGVIVQAPLRHMVTPGGFRMSVGMTNCGAFGWISDRRGYRYGGIDPQTGNPWPSMPPVFSKLAMTAAAQAGYPNFAADSCLINSYEPGSRLTLHQDRNEGDFSQPVVSVSLGLPAVFLFGGLTRSERPLRIPLNHGDVVVWGGPARLCHHGVLALKQGLHDVTGARRINLSFRRAR